MNTQTVRSHKLVVGANMMFAGNRATVHKIYMTRAGLLMLTIRFAGKPSMLPVLVDVIIPKNIDMEVLVDES